MKRFLPVMPLMFLLSCGGLFATDFEASNPRAFEVSLGVFRFSVFVKNANVVGDLFGVRFDVFLGNTATGNPVWTWTQDEPTLAPGATRTVQSTQTFAPETPGTYTLRSTVVYESEIDPADNVVDLIFTHLRAGCEASEQWHAGPGFSVVQPLDYWPKDPQLDELRPADVIGISALVTDADYLEQKCGCADNDTSVMRGPYPDRVTYQWTISEGPGTLIQSDDPEAASTVMYRLPTCPPNTDFFRVVIRVTVRNPGGSHAPDELVTGVIRFHVFKFESSSTYTYDVDASIDLPIDNGRSSSTSPVAGESCTPIEPVWTRSSPITAPLGIRSQSSEFLCPEYLTLLTVKASDTDDAILVCEGDQQGGCSPSDTSSRSERDGLVYTWSITGGAGEFPAGATGPSVVVRRSAGSATTVQCRITDAGLQAADEPLVLTVVLPAVGKPKALVGLGDDEGTSPSKLAEGVIDAWAGILGINRQPQTVYGGRSSALRSAWSSLKDKLEAAGYDVIADDSLLAEELTSRLENPCYKTIAFVGHGSSGDLNMARTFESGDWVNHRLNSTNLGLASQARFNCAKHPFVRELVLLACEAMLDDWPGKLYWGRSHGFRETKTFAMLRRWAYWTFEPLPPVILTVD